jgi:hypothetical protein
MEQLGSYWMYFHEIWVFLKILHRKFKIHENLTNIIGTWCEHLCTLMIVSHWIFLEWEILQTKVADKTKTQVFFFISSSKIVSFMRLCGIIRYNWTDHSWQYVWHMHLACWIYANKHAEYYLLLFYSNRGYKKMLQCYIIHTLPVLLHTYIAVQTPDLSHLFPALENRVLHKKGSRVLQPLQLVSIC